MENSSYLHGAMSNETLRAWQSINCDISPKNLMYPIFLVENDDDMQPIKSMPGVARYGINKLKPHLEELVQKGLSSVILFGVIEKLNKDDVGVHADSKENPVVRALPKLLTWFPNLTIACDVCLCPYTSHGHCGILHEDGRINHKESIKRIAEIAVEYAKHGAHIVAPSDMMDGRIKAIKDLLIKQDLVNKVAVLSYSVKLASSFYGPFRDAALSKPAFGDRQCYQLPSGSTGLALRAAARDVAEGADMLMVKPAMAYLDLVRKTKDAHPHHPMFVYQVSGEYAMIYHGAREGAFDLQKILNEILLSMRRAGADVLITYFAPQLLGWMETKSKY